MTRLQCQPRFALQEFLPYLLNRAGVKTGLVFGQALQAFGITLSEWRILSALWEQDGLRLNDIAAIVVADVSTTSRQVRALEQAALVARARSGADRRALHLVLTEAGRALTAEILGIAPRARADRHARIECGRACHAAAQPGQNFREPGRLRERAARPEWLATSRRAVASSPTGTGWADAALAGWWPRGW